MDANDISKLFSTLTDLGFKTGPVFFSLFLIYLGLSHLKSKPLNTFDHIYSTLLLVTGLVFAGFFCKSWLDEYENPYNQFAQISKLPTGSVIESDSDHFIKTNHMNYEYDRVVLLFAENECNDKKEIPFSIKKDNVKLSGILTCSKDFDRRISSKNKFKVDYDPDNGDLRLIGSSDDSENSKKIPSALIMEHLISNAHASGVRIIKLNKALTEPYISIEGIFDATSELQDFETPFTQKIQILDRLLATDSLMADILKIKPKNDYKKPLAEPLYVTLFDLARSSNKGLSIKANNLINKMNLEKDLLSAASDKALLEFIISNMEPKLATKITHNLLSQNVSDGDLVNYLKMQEKYNHKHLTRPTTTSVQGDRYFIKAEWDSKSTEEVKCVEASYKKIGMQHKDASKINNRTICYDKAFAKQAFKVLSVCQEVRLSFVYGGLCQ